jgi:adenosylcobinamide kinase/adenosylcobinamide-phosphate guanylyltransferase
MAHIILVTGGTRSGKSGYAQERGEQLGGRRCFIATCVPADAEMQERVSKHRRMRDSKDWETIEEPLQLVTSLAENNNYQVYLVDCLTLWVQNIMLDCLKNGVPCQESHVEQEALRLIDQAKSAPGTVILVSGEVGCGIVPENEVARKFRDLVGSCNQKIAALADEVILVSCGLPLFLKEKE